MSEEEHAAALLAEYAAVLALLPPELQARHAMFEAAYHAYRRVREELCGSRVVDLDLVRILVDCEGELFTEVCRLTDLGYDEQARRSVVKGSSTEVPR